MLRINKNNTILSLSMEQIAKRTKVEIAAAKRAEAMSKIAHNKELEQVQQERDWHKGETSNSPCYHHRCHHPLPPLRSQSSLGGDVEAAEVDCGNEH